jgi:hypothetical protein
VGERTSRRYIDRYEEAGLEGLIDKWLEQVSQRRAPVDEVRAVTERYRRRQLGWSEQAFATQQGRLPQELAAAAITIVEAANRYLEEVYRPAFNAELKMAKIEC